MYKKFLLQILVFLFTFAFTAKAAVPVSGKMIEESTKNALEYVNIVLLSLPDSTFVTGTISGEDGVFRFEKVNSGKYLLKISYVGLENKTVPVDVSANPVDLGDIFLKEANTLKEVVITSKTPPFQQSINGGIVANVSTSLLSTVGTANDVLQRIPGVIADDGKVTVFGKGAPIVYINNRKVHDMSELERLESSEISTVELITNPGAKYDAEGRAVLLIKTKTKVNGFSAQVTERLRQGKYLGDNENISVSYTKDKLNLFASYFHNHRKGVESENHNFTLKNTEGVWKHSTAMPEDAYSNKSQQVSTGFDFSINEKHAVGGQYQFYTGSSNLNFPVYSSSLLNGVEYDTALSQSLSHDNSRQHLLNAFYNGDFSKRYSLRLDFDYLKNHNDKDQHSNETVSTSTESNVIDILNQTDYDLWAGKLTNSLKSDIGLVEFGGEYNYITGNGFVRSNGYTNNTEFTNMEQKTAGFVSYSHKLAGINVAAGLRYEFTSEQFTQDKAKTKIIDRTYSDFYPNISLSGQIKGVDLSLAFNKRTQRPSFSQLNGNVIYVNRFVFQKGDPYLNKSNIYDLNLQATLKPFYLNIGYMYAKNPVLFMFKEQKDNTILSSYANFPKMQELTATLNFNQKIAFWQPNYTAGLDKPFFSAEYDGKMVDYNKVNYFFRMYSDFILPLGFVLSCNFRYQSDAQEAYYEAKSWKRLDAGLRKSFLNNNLRLNLTVYDIFDWVKENSYMQIDNLKWNADKKRETCYATLSITYLFNNYKKKYRGGSAAQDDINRF